VSLLISILALIVSIATAWLTLFRRGKLRMTRPVFVGFVWDTPGGEPKIFLRAMLYATGKRGYVIESLYLKVHCQRIEHLFSFWTLRQDGRMTIGSGTRVGEDGVSADFHFLPPKAGHTFKFLTGEYDIAVYAIIANRNSPTLLSKLRLTLSEEQARAMRPNMMNGVFFNWQPEQGSYHSYVEGPPTL
jgi:hypothetical protein